MPTIRDSLLEQLVDRIQSAQPAWNVQLRAPVNKGALPLAVVYQIGEDKRIRGNDAYSCTLAVSVELTVAVDKADATLDGGNPYRYLDRLVGELEKVVHDPDAWGQNPKFTDVSIDGHDVAESDEEDFSTLQALVRVTFQYQQFLADLEA